MSLVVVADHRVDETRHHAVPVVVARWSTRVLAWCVILGCTVVLLAAVVVPRVSGATPYAVLTGSMRPGLPPGTLAVVRPVPADSLRPGQVITYQLYSGRPTVVTHRLVQSRTTADGRTEWQTRGDANDVADARWVRPEQVRGRLWYAVPQVGRANTVLNGAEHQLLVYAVAAALVVYAGAMFAGAAWDRRRQRSASRLRRPEMAP